MQIKWVLETTTIFGDCFQDSKNCYSLCVHDLWPQPISEKGRLFVFCEYVCEAEASNIADLSLRSDKTFCWKVEWTTDAAPSFPSLVELLVALQGDMTPIELLNNCCGNYNNHNPLDESPIRHPPYSGSISGLSVQAAASESHLSALWHMVSVVTRVADWSSFWESWAGAAPLPSHTP